MYLSHYHVYFICSQLAALPEDSCLSIFPRPRPAVKESTVSTERHGEDGVEEEPIAQQHNAPEIEPIGKVTVYCTCE